MVVKPLCKVCGARHWGAEEHVFAGPARAGSLGAKLVRPRAEKVEIGQAHEAITARYPKVLAELAKGPDAEGDALGAYLKAEKAKKAAYMRAYRARKKESQ